MQLLGFVQSQMTRAMRISSSLQDSSTIYVMKVRSPGGVVCPLETSKTQPIQGVDQADSAHIMVYK